MVKKEKASPDESSSAEPGYEDKLRFTSVISKPMASKKLAKKVSKRNRRETLTLPVCIYVQGSRLL